MKVQKPFFALLFVILMQHSVFAFQSQIPSSGTIPLPTFEQIESWLLDYENESSPLTAFFHLEINQSGKMIEKTQGQMTLFRKNGLRNFSLKAFRPLNPNLFTLKSTGTSFQMNVPSLDVLFQGEIASQDLTFEDWAFHPAELIQMLDPSERTHWQGRTAVGQSRDYWIVRNWEGPAGAEYEKQRIYFDRTLRLPVVEETLNPQGAVIKKISWTYLTNVDGFRHLQNIRLENMLRDSFMTVHITQAASEIPKRINPLDIS